MRSERLMKPSSTRVAHAYLRKQARRYNWRDVEDMEPEKALSMLEDLSREAGRNAKRRLDSIRMNAYDLRKQEEELEKGWDKWDWDILAKYGVITDDEAEFAAEVLAHYSP